MVKQSSEKYAEYKMRTSHSGTMNSARHNRVQVAESSGCCSSSKKKVYEPPPRPARTQQYQPPQQQQNQPTAHQRTHLRLDPPDPFYSRHGRIRKNPNRGKKPFYGKNQVHTTTSLRQTNTTNTSSPAPPPPTHHQPAKAKTNCCCTIL